MSKFRIAICFVVLVFVQISAIAYSFAPSFTKVNISSECRKSFIEKYQIKPIEDYNSNEKFIKVYMHDLNEIKIMSLEEYIFGVLMAEMPSYYPAEALKAGAVAARSYLIYQTENYRDIKKDYHKGADICTDYSHCQAYISYEDAVEAWSEEWMELVEDKIKQAVKATEGEIMTYDGKPINAVYHASSFKKTECAENLWGNYVPYLVSVESSGEEQTGGFFSEYTISFEDFRTRLQLCGINAGELVDGNMTIYTLLHDSGRVKSMYIKNTNFPEIIEIDGAKVRNIFSLKSTSFEVKTDNSNKTVTFHVRGYGHGVGLSQNGAMVMAENGSDYKEILEHYYKGATLANIDCE